MSWVCIISNLYARKRMQISNVGLLLCCSLGLIVIIDICLQMSQCGSILSQTMPSADQLYCCAVDPQRISSLPCQGCFSFDETKNLDGQRKAGAAVIGVEPKGKR